MQLTVLFKVINLITDSPKDHNRLIEKSDFFPYRSVINVKFRGVSPNAMPIDKIFRRHGCRGPLILDIKIPLNLTFLADHPLAI